MSDEWAVPSGMTPQDNPGQPKDGIGALVKRIHDNAVEMRDRFNNLLKQAGIRVEKDLVRFTGAVRIEGTLDLPAGIIGNDALTSPVVPDSGFATAATFAIPAGQANRVTRASFTLTVPNGYTSALVQAVGVSGGWNTGGSTDYLYSYLEIGPTPASAYVGSPTCLNGTTAVSNVFRNVLIEGLSGGDPIVVSIQPYTYVNTWPSAANNSVTVSATCLFMR